MNLLFASAYFPWPKNRGSSLRSYHILKSLTQRHRVTLVAFSDGQAGQSENCPLGQMCARVIEIDVRSCDPDQRKRLDLWAPFPQRLQALLSSPLPNIIRMGYSEAFLQVLRELNRREKFDVAWAVRSHVAEMVRSAGLPQIIVDVDDLENIKLRQTLRLSPWYRSKPFHYAEHAKMCAYERLLARRFSALVVCKHEDRGFFGSDCDKVFVVPNGVENHPPTDPSLELADTILFVGQLGYEPNVDGIRFFARSILPILRSWNPNVQFMIVGCDADREVKALHNGKTCVVFEDVPDLQPYYEKASIAVAPLRLGSGTRLKILEALGRGKAVVSTTIGAEGIDLRPGIDLEIADSAEAFAQTCARLLADKAARQRLGTSGRARVWAKYRWDSIGETVNHVVTSLRTTPGN